MRSLKARLDRIEEQIGRHRGTYIFLVGDSEYSDFKTKQEYNEEIAKPKYKNTNVIQITDFWKR